MSDMEESIRQTVRELFASEQVELLIGYENGSLAHRSRPCILRSGEEASRLVWNQFCTNNLAVYLPRLFENRSGRPDTDEVPPKVGIVAKGCDARSVLEILGENQVRRENLTVIGVPCTGMVDPQKMEEVVGADADWRECPGGIPEVTTRSGDVTRLKSDDFLMEACAECPCPVPDDADVLIEGDSRPTSDRRYVRVKEMEARPEGEKWQHFKDEFSRCIRCYACREVCPNCFCKICFASQTKPSWIGAGDDSSDVLLYHLIRAFHQAGRCVGCDACSRACPVGIDLRLINQKLCKDVEEMFDYVPGISKEKLSPLRTFAEADSQSFMTLP